MAARSVVAAHILQRLDRARRLDPTLTVKAAARELGISTSSIYKMRAGTRSGMGSIAKRVMLSPGSVSNEFTVTYKSGDRVASKNIYVQGARTRADALVIRHDPKTRRAVSRQLAKEEGDAKRQLRGSLPWNRKQRTGLRITNVIQPRRPHAEATFIQGTRDFTA
jgi:hypothetical protein